MTLTQDFSPKPGLEDICEGSSGSRDFVEMNREKFP